MNLVIDTHLITFANIIYIFQVELSSAPKLDTKNSEISISSDSCIHNTLARSSLTNSFVGKRTSAFEIYQKPTISRNSVSPFTADATTTYFTESDEVEGYEKRVIAISDNLRLIRIRSNETMTDILKHLTEQNHLLLRLCNDLNEELLEIQLRKENLKIKLEAVINID